MNPRLFDLLPAVYRQRDAAQGGQLEALLDLIDEQRAVVAGDIAGLYDDWFIETCQDRIVPYLGELVGYRPAHEVGEPGGGRFLFPRADVARTIANRRRRGAFSVLARQAGDVAGWPARAVELFTVLGILQNVRRPDPGRARLADLRDGDALLRLGGPFDTLARIADTRFPSTAAGPRPALPGLALFVWRLRAQPVTLRQAHCREDAGREFFTFSVLGNDRALFSRPQPAADGAAVTGEPQVPDVIRRRLMERRPGEYYGPGRSLRIWWVPPGPPPPRGTPLWTLREPVGPERIIVADLSGWRYRTPDGRVAVDPELGRIAFSPRPGQQPRRVWVDYHQGVLADLGGGEYRRVLTAPGPETRVYRVGEQEDHPTIRQALDRWAADRPRHAIIEITDSAVYTEPVEIEIGDRQGLELRASTGAAPVIRLLDWQTDQSDAVTVTSGDGGCLVLDGLTVAGRGIRIGGGLATVAIRHCTLVPGWEIDPGCEPLRPTEASLDLDLAGARLSVEHSILGTVRAAYTRGREPLAIDLADSILDATGTDREALGAPGCEFAHVLLTVRRCTVFGRIAVHAITLAQDSILHGAVRVARRRDGCLRFCYVPPGSRTPRRFQCQPDLVLAAVGERRRRGELSDAQAATARRHEATRVEPEYAGTHYGAAHYGDLAVTAAPEIRRGGADRAAMGVFHDLFQPQREANLHARLDDAVPAGVRAATVFVN